MMRQSIGASERPIKAPWLYTMWYIMGMCTGFYNLSNLDTEGSNFFEAHQNLQGRIIHQHYQHTSDRVKFEGIEPPKNIGISLRILGNTSARNLGSNNYLPYPLLPVRAFFVYLNTYLNIYD